jgi:hypothetical protein
MRTHPRSAARCRDEDRPGAGCRGRRRVCALALALLAAAWSAPSGGTDAPARAGAAPPALPFTDVTAAAGIRFVHRNAATGEKLLPETMGGGAAFFDYDRDGDPDLLLLHSDPAADPPAVLYANDGAGRFTDVTAASGLAQALPKGFLGMGVAVADVDGDGWRDLFLTAVGRDRLLRNREGRFSDATEAAGVAGPADAWSTAAAFLDADGDGDLDLFVARYVVWSADDDRRRAFEMDGVGRAYGLPQSYPGTQPALFRNRGDGSFEEVGAEAGVHVTDASGAALGKGMAVVAEDFDGDGRTDVFMANDTTRNFLFHNLGGGRFEELGELWGVSYGPDGGATGAMGSDLGDLGGSGRRALVVGNFAREVSSLYQASPEDPTFFADQALVAGLGPATRTPLTFAVLLLDADLDGRLDVLQVNGHVEPGIAGADPVQSYRQPPQLFWNAGPARPGRPDAAPRLLPVPEAALGDLPRPLAGRGATYADVDDDGDLDLLLTQVGGPAVLLRNDQETGHRWLRVRLEGRPPNTDAVGAHVVLVTRRRPPVEDEETAGDEPATKPAPAGEATAGEATDVERRVQRRTVQTSRGYLSAVELPLTFGLGDDEEVESLRVTWPDGRSRVLGGADVEPGALHVVAEPATGSAPAADAPQTQDGPASPGDGADSAPGAPA